MDFDAAVETLRARLADLALVMVFGSHARGDARADSDVDLAVLTDRELDAALQWQLRDELSTRLGAEVDLLDLRRADDVISVQVVEHGRVLFERSRADRERFEMLALGRYARLNESRRGILDDVRERGRIHG